MEIYRGIEKSNHNNIFVFIYIFFRYVHYDVNYLYLDENIHC